MATDDDKPWSAEAFEGIDRSTGDNRLFGTYTEALSKPLTVEMLLDAMREIEERAPRPPCGTKEPHIGPPVKMGERFRCVVCGERLVMATDDRCISLAELDAWKLGWP